VLTLSYERLGLRPGDLVLDVGAGAGRHSFGAIQRGARAVALDLSDTDLKHVIQTCAEFDYEGGYCVNADALSIPFPEATFDRVIASEVLEHIPSDTQAMSEIARVTKPGGTIAVTVPRFGQEIVCWALSREYHDTPGGHVRIYRQSQLASRLEGAGLRVQGVGFAHALHTPYWWLRCIVGPNNVDNPLVRAYRSFLEWDIMTGPPLVRLTERVLNPVLGKSLVLYMVKP
jgi:SAM-dependent methyltransferase